MTESFESELRAAFNTRLEALSPERETRVREYDYRSRTRHLRRLWAILGAGSTALTGCIVAAVLILSSGAPAAYAGWQAVPTTPPSAAVAAAAAKCDKVGPLQTDVFTGEPVLSETRGRYTAATYVTGGRVYSCLYSGPGAFTVTTFNQLGPVHTAPGPNDLSVPYTLIGRIDPVTGVVGAGLAELTGTVPASLNGVPLFKVAPGKGTLADRIRTQMILNRANKIRNEYYLQSDGGYGQYALGQAGSNVSKVTFAFANGETVVATVQNGWYFAWWPWFTNPTSVTVTTSSGTVSSPMRAPSKRGGLQTPAPGCHPGSTGCVFVKTPISATTTSIAPARPVSLAKTYAILQDTSALSKTPVPATFRGGANVDPDLSAARMAQGPDNQRIWLIPGATGYCVVTQDAGGGSGSCGPNSTANGVGMLGFTGGYSGPNGSYETVIGFVPNGNSTVKFTETNGQMLIVPVTNNAIFAQIPKPQTFATMQYKDFYGTEITQSLPTLTGPSARSPRRSHAPATP